MSVGLVITVPITEAVYVSLIGPFMNYYARIPQAQNSAEAAWICNNSKLKSLWCSTYTEEQVNECIQKYGGQIIELYADGIDFDYFQLEQFREEIKGHDRLQAKL